MERIISILYNSWGWIDFLIMMITVIGFVMAFTDFKPVIKSRKGKGAAGLLLVILSLFLGASVAVHFSFVKMPYIINQELADARYYLSEKGLEVELMVGSCIEESSDNKVYWASRESGDLVYTGETIVLYASIYETDEGGGSSGEEITAEETDGRVLVPAVTGMTELEAINTLKAFGLNFTGSLYGSQTEFDDEKTYYVVAQDIPAGSEVDAGTIVRLWLFGINYVEQQ